MPQRTVPVLDAVRYPSVSHCNLAVQASITCKVATLRDKIMTVLQDHIDIIFVIDDSCRLPVLGRSYNANRDRYTWKNRLLDESGEVLHMECDQYIVGEVSSSSMKKKNRSKQCASRVFLEKETHWNSQGTSQNVSSSTTDE